MPGNVELGDVTPAVGGRWQQPQKGEVLHAADATPDRFGALHQGVLGRWAEDAELERNPASRASTRGGTCPTSDTHGWRCPKPELADMGKREKAQTKRSRVRPEVGARSECGALCRKVRIRRTGPSRRNAFPSLLWITPTIFVAISSETPLIGLLSRLCARARRVSQVWL
jgi:hypothetical protein